MNNVSSIEILHEDAHILVINKPAGVLVHNDGRENSETVVEWFLKRAPEAKGVGEPGNAQNGTPLERSGVVHRLDKDTSGVLILAKNQGAFLHLKAQFHDRLAKKEYHAFVYGTMKERWATINRAIGRHSRDFKLRSAERGAKGLLRPAVTDWECLTQSRTHAYLKVAPKTGRTHQIRVHMKSIGHPIVGDQLYASPEFLKKDNLGFERLALHARSLTIVLPDGGEHVFTAPFPEDFLEAQRVIVQ